MPDDWWICRTCKHWSKSLQFARYNRKGARHGNLRQSSASRGALVQGTGSPMAITKGAISHARPGVGWNSGLGLVVEIPNFWKHRFQSFITGGAICELHGRPKRALNLLVGRWSARRGWHGVLDDPRPEVAVRTMRVLKLGHDAAGHGGSNVQCWSRRGRPRFKLLLGVVPEVLVASVVHKWLSLPSACHVPGMQVVHCNTWIARHHSPLKSANASGQAASVIGCVLCQHAIDHSHMLRRFCHAHRIETGEHVVGIVDFGERC